jgi:hypothetical protein
MIDAETLTEMIEAAMSRNPEPEVSDQAINDALAVWNVPIGARTAT